MKVYARLTARLSDEPRKALTAVLAPDNEGLPEGLQLSMSEAEGSAEYRIASESPAAVLSTALALLRDMALFSEVWLLSHGKDAGRTRERN